MEKESRYFEDLSSKAVDVRYKVSKGAEKRSYHLHRQLEIVYVLSDGVYCSFEHSDLKVRVPKHSLLLVDAMTLHFLFTEEPGLPCERYVLFFLPGFLDGIDLSDFNLLDCFSVRRDYGEAVVPVPEARREELEDRFRLMCRDFSELEGCTDETRASELKLVLRMDLARLLIDVSHLHRENLLRMGIPSELKSPSENRLGSEIRAYLERNNDRQVSVEEICRQFMIGKTRLYEVFDRLYGMTVYECSLKTRMVKAKDYLINTDYSIELISQRIGYENLSSFSRAFSREFGISPLQYRARHS